MDPMTVPSSRGSCREARAALGPLGLALAFVGGCAGGPETLSALALSSQPATTLAELRDRFVHVGLGGEMTWRGDGVTISGGPGAFVVPLDHPDYRIHVDVRADDGANSGVFVRARSGLVFPTGVEVQIDARDPKNPTGSIYDRARAATAPPPAGTWFHLEVVARGDRVESLVDGAFAAAVEDVKPDGRLFALQAHHPGSVVRFENLTIERLP